MLLLLAGVSVLLVGCTRPATDTSPEWIGYYNGKSTSGDYAIGICTAGDVADGFVRDTVHSPIRPPSGYTHIAAPCVVVAEGTFYMYVEGWAEESHSWRDVLLLTSVDGYSWSYFPKNPVLTCDGGARRCSVLYEPADTGREYKMWYVRSATLDIAFAYSSDGVTWAKSTAPVLPLGSPGEWDDKQVIVGGVWKEGDLYYLFYAGYDGRHYRGGYATAENPEGPYVRASENPIIVPRNQADSEVLADIERGSREVVVAQPAAFEVGEAVVLCNELGRWEMSRVEGRRDTSLLLANSVVQDYTRSHGTRVRSWASQDVHSTYVWKADGMWHLVITAFGCQKGVMTSVNFMIEATGYMTGKSLSSLTWNFRASPLLPMSSSTDLSWDQCSRENLFLYRP